MNTHIPHKASPAHETTTGQLPSTFNTTITSTAETSGGQTAETSTTASHSACNPTACDTTAASSVASYFHPNTAVALIASHRQQGNPSLEYIRNVSLEFGNIVPDYLVGKYAAVLFISCRFHRLNPNYIWSRISSLGRNYKTRVLICLVDLPDYENSLQDITLIALNGKMALLLAWSHLEVARLLETLKAYEAKPSDILRGKVEGTHATRVAGILTAVPAVNKTDAATIMGQFQSLSDIFKADKKRFEECPGIGEKKLRALISSFRDPFF